MATRNSTEIGGAVDNSTKRGMVLPFQPLSLAFNHVSYYVDMPDVSRHQVFHFFGHLHRSFLFLKLLFSVRDTLDLYNQGCCGSPESVMSGNMCTVFLIRKHISLIDNIFQCKFLTVR